MKAQLAFALLVVLISSVSMQAHERRLRRRFRSNPQDRQFQREPNSLSLKFERASREGVSQESNKFAVQFNGRRVKEFTPTDYEIHQEQFHFRPRHGKNKVSFIGTGISDGLGQGIDNVKLFKKANNGQQNVIVNGGFELGHQLGTGWSIFANGKIPGWSTTDNELEIGYGRIYNGRWPDNTHIVELDANRNSNVFQEVNF